MDFQLLLNWAIGPVYLVCTNKHWTVYIMAVFSKLVKTGRKKRTWIWVLIVQKKKLASQKTCAFRSSAEYFNRVFCFVFSHVYSFAGLACLRVVEYSVLKINLEASRDRSVENGQYTVLKSPLWFPCCGCVKCKTLSVNFLAHKRIGMSCTKLCDISTTFPGIIIIDNCIDMQLLSNLGKHQ